MESWKAQLETTKTVFAEFLEFSDGGNGKGDSTFRILEFLEILSRKGLSNFPQRSPNFLSKNSPNFPQSSRQYLQKNSAIRNIPAKYLNYWNFGSKHFEKLCIYFAFPVRLPTNLPDSFQSKLQSQLNTLKLQRSFVVDILLCFDTTGGGL